MIKQQADQAVGYSYRKSVQSPTLNLFRPALLLLLLLLRLLFVLLLILLSMLSGLLSADLEAVLPFPVLTLTVLLGPVVQIVEKGITTRELRAGGSPAGFKSGKVSTAGLMSIAIGRPILVVSGCSVSARLIALTYLQPRLWLAASHRGRVLQKPLCLIE